MRRRLPALLAAGLVLSACAQVGQGEGASTGPESGTGPGAGPRVADTAQKAAQESAQKAAQKTTQRTTLKTTQDAAEKQAQEQARGEARKQARDEALKVAVRPQPWTPRTILRPKPLTPLARQALAAPDSPLAGWPWAVPRAVADDGAWRAYQGARGDLRALLARIAETPRAMWFGNWIGVRSIGAKVRAYIADSQRGNKNALVQMAIFRVVPWEHAACGRNPSGREAADYRAWIDNFATAVGRTHTAIVLQPDGPFALCSPGGPAGADSPTKLIAYAAQRLSALPNTSVYIEIGASDWPAAGQGGVASVMRFLVPMGIRHARGVALNGTHYTDTGDDIVRGAAVVRALEAIGVTGKKVVINTANQGHPFEFGHFQGKGKADNAPVCRSLADPGTCVALGIPPTPEVAHPRWGLSPRTNKLARKYVDGYLWFGRPWLHMQASPFVLDRAVGLARTWKWTASRVGQAIAVE